MTENKSILYIGLDFSLSKPGMTIYYNGEINFYIFPQKLSKANVKSLEAVDINVYNRDLEPVQRGDSTEMVMSHTIRSHNLAMEITNIIKSYMDKHSIEGENVMFASEGLSFRSSGASGLDLAGYKGVLLAYLYSKLNIRNIYTYSPMTVKSIAGCSTKETRGDKHAMIKAFMNENINHKFHKALNNKELMTRGERNYILCVDDIVDSYFVLKTMLSQNG